MFTIETNFIGDFNIGDNINYNLDLLSELYAFQNQLSGEKRALIIKPITITITSIIEAVLYDFINRSREFVIEGVEGITEEEQERVKNMNGDKLNTYISFLQGKNGLSIFDHYEGDFYGTLTSLKDWRNRIHIQNDSNKKPFKEIEIYTPRMQGKAEQVLEFILLTLSENHSRPDDLGRYIRDFALPWEAKYPAGL